MLVDVLKGPLCIHEVPGLNLGPGAGCLHLDFHGFPQSVEINGGIVCSTAFRIVILLNIKQPYQFITPFKCTKNQLGSKYCEDMEYRKLQ